MKKKTEQNRSKVICQPLNASPPSIFKCLSKLEKKKLKFIFLIEDQNGLQVPQSSREDQKQVCKPLHFAILCSQAKSKDQRLTLKAKMHALQHILLKCCVFYHLLPLFFINFYFKPQDIVKTCFGVEAGRQDVECCYLYVKFYFCTNLFENMFALLCRFSK